MKKSRLRTEAGRAVILQNKKLAQESSEGQIVAATAGEDNPKPDLDAEIQDESFDDAQWLDSVDQSNLEQVNSDLLVKSFELKWTDTANLQGDRSSFGGTSRATYFRARQVQQQQ